MNKKNIIGILVVSVFLTGGMIASSYMLSRLFVNIQHENKLSVKGYAEKAVRSDIGTFTATLSVQAPNMASGYKKLKSDTDKLIEIIKSYGFKDDEIGVNSMNTNKVFAKINGKDTNDIQYYMLTQPVTVRSGNIDLVDSKHKELYSLLTQGLDISVNPPDYFISDLEKYKQELIAAATHNAADRAKIMADNCGGQIKKLLSAKQGIIQITAPDSADVSDYGVFDTKSPKKVIKIVVSLDFLVQ